MARAILKTIGTPAREGVRKIFVALAKKHLRKGGVSTVRRAALIPPARPGNMGDAAMLSAAGDYLRAQGFESVDLLDENVWKLDTPIDRQVATSRFFFNNSPLQQASIILGLRRYSHIFFVGADVIDGAYARTSVMRRIALLAEASSAGKTAVILGASYNENPHEDVRQALEASPQSMHICARDPLSWQRLTKATHRTIRQTADVAFLLEAAGDHPDAVAAIAWIHERRAAGDKIVAINMNYLLHERHPGLRRSYDHVVGALKAKGCSFVMVPHDTRSAQSDVAHLEQLIADNRAILGESAYLLRTDSPKATKAALAEVDMLISGRMHAMILAMGAGTPGIGIAYQNKFEGMLELFDMAPDAFTISPESAVQDPGELEAKAMRILDDLPRIRGNLSAKFPEVRTLAIGNFDVG